MNIHPCKLALWLWCFLCYFVRIRIYILTCCRAGRSTHYFAVWTTDFRWWRLNMNGCYLMLNCCHWSVKHLSLIWNSKCLLNGWRWAERRGLCYWERKKRGICGQNWPSKGKKVIWALTLNANISLQLQKIKRWTCWFPWWVDLNQVGEWLSRKLDVACSYDFATV